MTKVCSKCGLEKDVAQFSKNNKRKDGLFLWCKACVKEHDKKRNSNPEVVAKRKQRRYIPVLGTKITCRECGLEKDESLFDLSPSNSTGRSYQCKDCRAAYHRKRLEHTKPDARRKGEHQTEEQRTESKRLAQRAYVESNRDEVNRRAREGTKKRRKTDPNFAIKTQLTNRLISAVRNGQKVGSGVRDLGCTIPELRLHLEAKFHPGMTWENRGHGFGKWNIDHIMPMAAFDLTDRQHVVLACHYLNLQPLWHEQNMSKGDKIGFEFGQV